MCRRNCAKQKLCANRSQCVPDELSSQKRKARHLLFTTLRYRSFLSRQAPKSEEERRQRKYPVAEEAAKILLKADNGEWTLGFWRTTIVSKPSAAFLASDISSFNQEMPQGRLQLF